MENGNSEPESTTSKPEDTQAEKQPAAGAGLISFEDFMKVQLRVAEILEAEVVPKSKKLVKLQVSLGEELGTRQIIAGIAPYYEDLETLISRRIVVVANLKPAKLMGLESQGMLLAAATEDGSALNLLNPGDMPAGATVR